eukprot:Tbor_TRINITY_DN603_c0_g1::TRINITY_DN603_c0_g1_i1::g.1631::m.1631
MPTLTFMEEMKDKASRLIPSQFTNLIEDTTKETLTSFNYEHTMIICDHANSNPDNVVQIVRAVRRRIDHPNSKVQYFTVLLLDALIKNCYEELHNEIAVTKALQRGLVNIAVKVPTRDGEYEAKKCALTLILNMSYWFIGAKHDETKMLSKLADEVRALTNPLVFEDIEADPTYQLKRAPPNRTAQQRQRRPRNTANQNSNRLAGEQQRVVTAIPVYQYTGEQISGMLDACSLLSECLNEAEMSNRSIIGDEIISGIAVEVRSEHRKMSILISSGAEMENIDVLLTVSDSQTAVMQYLQDVIKNSKNQKKENAQDGAVPIVTQQPYVGESKSAKVHEGANDNNVDKISKKTAKASKFRKVQPRQLPAMEEGEEMELNFFDDNTTEKSDAEKNKHGGEIDDLFHPPQSDNANFSPISSPHEAPDASNRDHSINNDTSEQQDDFDAFLNSRTGKK